MESCAAYYFAKGLAGSSQKTYKSGKNHYLQFCQLCNSTPLPVSELVLCKFVSFLASEGLKHRTIKSHLLGVWYFQIRSGLPDLFIGSHMPHLNYTIQGIKRMESEKGGGQRTELPITPPLLRHLRSMWSKSANSRNTKMIWVASCLAFFRFLRVGEMTALEDGSFDSAMHLGFSNITVDSLTSPSFIRVTIKQSKRDPFRRGVDLFLGRTQTDLCPVAAILSYLAVRGAGPCPLFYFEDGRWLTRSRFVTQVPSQLLGWTRVNTTVTVFV